MGTICMKLHPKTTANDVRELEKATEKIIAAPPAPSQCLLWNSQAADAAAALEEPPAAQKQHQFSSLHMGY